MMHNRNSKFIIKTTLFVNKTKLDRTQVETLRTNILHYGRRQ